MLFFKKNLERKKEKEAPIFLFVSLFEIISGSDL